MSKDSNRIAIALISDHKDDLLMGLREKEQKWTNPSGHIYEGECPYEGCRRELLEETGLDVISIELCRIEYNKKKGLMLYLFKVTVDPKQEIDFSNDPDKEFLSVGYIDPNEVADMLHVPIEENIALKYWANH